jgi:hypothetical protein
MVGPTTKLLWEGVSSLQRALSLEWFARPMSIHHKKVHVILNASSLAQRRLIVQSSLSQYQPLIRVDSSKLWIW